MEKIHEFAKISDVQKIMNSWAKTTGLGAALLEADGSQICVTPGASTSAASGLAHTSEEIVVKNTKVGSVFVSATIGGESNVDFDSAADLLVNTVSTVLELEYDKKVNDAQKARLTEGISQCEALVGVIQDKTKSLNSIQGRQNILALNASIEAARAGDAGKGFAVVAKEVGSLSQQSKGLNEEISKTILDISKAVHNMTSGADAQ